VVITDGKMASIMEGNAREVSCELVDVGDSVLMPGFVDTHVHINEPGRTAWEGFETATKAAAAGGLTTLVDMPLNSSPVTTTLQAFHQKLTAAGRGLHVHTGFWGGIIPGNANEIDALAHAGVLGFKAFLTHSGIDEFPNVTLQDLEEAMPAIARQGLPLLVHCELESAQSPEIGHDVRSYAGYLASRPAAWEEEAIRLMVQLSEVHHCRVHIVHLSAASSVKLVREAKARGVPVTAETAQHYLYFSAEDIADGQTIFKCAPPIRDLENRESLWAALKCGDIDFVATDHSPAPPSEKQLESGDFTKAWGGIASLQFAFPALWTAAKPRGCTLNDMATWLSERPAVLAGLAHRKGRIAVGYDADLVVLNAGKKFRVTESLIHHRHKVTPYLGAELEGVVEQTYIEGSIVYDRGEFRNPGGGKIITLVS
jgi:allantoinase